MHIRNINIGRRTLVLSTLSLIVGALLFFNSKTFLSLVQKTLAITFFVGLLTLVTENFSSRIKILGIWTAIVFTFIGAGGISFLASGQLCNMNSVVKYKVAENPLTGEIVHKRFAGSGTPSCRDFSFPWYYKDSNKSEIVSFCKENPKKAYCVRNVDSVNPNLENLSQRNKMKYMR